MRHLKKALCLFCLLAGLVASSTVTASTYDLGTVTASKVTSPIDFAGSFDDLFTFSLGSGNGIDASAFGFDLFGSVQSLSFALVGKNAQVNPGDWINVTASTNTGFFSAANTFGSLSLGNAFDLHVKGMGYFGNYNITITPVPEPGTWALLFAGLGLMGTIIRRRNTQNND